MESASGFKDTYKKPNWLGMKVFKCGQCPFGHWLPEYRLICTHSSMVNKIDKERLVSPGELDGMCPLPEARSNLPQGSQGDATDMDEGNPGNA